MDIVDRNGNCLAFDTDAGRRFVVDLARYSEGILTERAVKRRYPLDAETWERLGSDDDLVEMIENEKARRIRDGSSARERAQLHFAEAPNVLGGIMKNEQASPRHRIESAKELRVVAANTGPDATATPTTFRITFNLGDHTEIYEKQVNVSPDPQQELLPWGTSLND